MHTLRKCTVQEAKLPVKKISSGSVARRDLILALKGSPSDASDPSQNYLFVYS
jgi:hypothetical protein